LPVINRLGCKCSFLRLGINYGPGLDLGQVLPPSDEAEPYPQHFILDFFVTNDVFTPCRLFLVQSKVSRRGQEPTIESSTGMMLHSGMLWPYSQALDWAGKAYKEQTC
jgi:hypothetical protein